MTNEAGSPSELLARVLQRQDDLEVRCARLEEKVGIAPLAWVPVAARQVHVAAVVVEEAQVAEPVAAADPYRSAPAPELPPREPLPTTAPAPGLESRVGLAWINRVGIITLILGVAFAFRTAVDNGWIGPVGRVGVGLAAAALALLGGERMWRRDQRVFAQGLTSLGCALMYLSLWAAFSLYALIGRELAFGFLVGATAGTMMLALRYRAQVIALLALATGYLTPPLLSSGASHALVFLGYVALLDTAALVLARRRAWPLLEYLAATATVVLFGAWLVTIAGHATGTERALATLFLLVFYAQLSAARAPLWFAVHPLACLAIATAWPTEQVMPLLLVVAAGSLAVSRVRGLAAAPLVGGVCFWLGYAVSAPSQLPWLVLGFALFTGWIVWSAVARRRAPRDHDLFLLAVNSIAFFAASYFVLEPEHNAYVGGVTVALAAVHAAIAKVLWDPTRAGAERNTAPGALALGLGLALFTLALPIQLAGASLTIAWALEGAVLAWLAGRHDSGKLDGVAYAALAIALVHLLTDVGHARADLTPIANPRCLAFLVTAAAMFATSRFRKTAVSPVVYVVGHALVLLGASLELHTWAHHALGSADRFAFVSVGVSILLALYAFALVTLGVIRRSPLDRVIGLVLIGGVVAKLYLADVWDLDRAFRIAAFLGLGALLLATSYLYSRYRAVVERLWREPG